MARRLYTDYQQIYKILKNHPAMAELLTDFAIDDYNFKEVCMFMTTNYAKISTYNLKDLYYSQTWSTLEPDQASPYVKRFNKVSDLPAPSSFIDNGTVYYVINPLPGAYYIFDSLKMEWKLDSSFTEMSPTDYLAYQKLTGNMIWENDSGNFILSMINGKRSWGKTTQTGPIVGKLVRVADLPTATASVGDIYTITGEDILDVLATYYGYTSPTYVPPWDHVMSASGTKLTELLYFTLFYFIYLSSDSFYEKHILDFLPQYDRDQVLSQPKTNLFMQGLGKKLDELENFMISLENSFDIDQCPEELLDYLGQNLGYEKEDFTLSNLSFRELLKNIIEIYKVKGTNYSFSFFFKFLGFSINLKEFYFNKDVQNPEAFPGADSNKVEFYLTTKNPLFETSTNISVPHLSSIKNINDWDIEKLALETNLCTNAVPYMLGLESYNNDGKKFHGNPWKYFKTNLIEYQLSPFLNKINLTASDNETIKKYVKFLSPTYLFTWINVNILPWMESFEIQTEDLLTQINVQLGDPRPTPSPWPMFTPGDKGVPVHVSGTPFKKKTKNDVGFTGPYLDYENVETYFYLYGSKLEDSIPLYPLEKLEMPDINGASILQYYDKDSTAYYLKNNVDELNQNCMMFLRKHGIRSNEGAPFRLLKNPLEIYEQDFPRGIFIEGQYYGILDFYNKTQTTYEIKPGLGSTEIGYAKRFMNLISKIGDIISVEIQNNMNLGGDDIVGTILKRDGSTVRLKEDPSFIVDLKHKAKKRLGFDNLQITVEKIGGKSVQYSSKSYPALPDTMSPFPTEVLFLSNNVSFSWNECFGSGDYRIQIARDQKFINIFEENVIPENYYTTQKKLSNDIYYWRMKVKNDSVLDLMRPLNKITFEYYLNRIGQTNSIGQSAFPPSTLADKSFFISKYDSIPTDGVHYDSVLGKFVTSSTIYKLKSNCTQAELDRISSIFFYIGYNWSPWTQFSSFDLQVSPFPYNGELLKRDVNSTVDLVLNDVDTKYYGKETEYMNSIWTQVLNPLGYVFEGLELTLKWPVNIMAEIYELEVNTDPNFGEKIDADGNKTVDLTTRLVLVSTTIPEFFVSYDSVWERYYIVNGNFYWRYRIKHVTLGWRDWENVYNFGVNF